MRTKTEIAEKVKLVGAELDKNITFEQREVINAILKTLEEDLGLEEIEERFGDGHETDTESACEKAREWLDGEITDEEFNEEFNYHPKT